MDNWLKEKGKEVWCPYEDGNVIIGLSMIGSCPGKCLGEFELKDGECFVYLNS